MRIDINQGWIEETNQLGIWLSVGTDTRYKVSVTSLQDSIPSCLTLRHSPFRKFRNGLPYVTLPSAMPVDHQDTKSTSTPVRNLHEYGTMRAFHLDHFVLHAT